MGGSVKEVYKAVFRDRNGQLRSAMYCRHGSHWRRHYLKYSTEGFTVPSVGKIFAFDSELHARLFSWNHEIWLAETHEVSDFEPDRVPELDLCWCTVKRFWKTHVIEGIDTTFVPDHTVLCEDLRLIEQIG
jgi:hypothetical protein